MEEINVEKLTEDINKVVDALWVGIEADVPVVLKPEEAQTLAIYINLLTTAFENISLDN